MDLLGYSQETLATAANVSQNTINKILVGKTKESRKPPLIAHALNTTVEYLTTGHDKIKDPTAPYAVNAQNNRALELVRLIDAKYKAGKLTDSQLKLLAQLINELTKQ